MDTLNELKKLLERQDSKEENLRLEKEKRFINVAAERMGSAKKVNSIQGYEPKEMLVFLNQDKKELQKILGGEWMEMEEEEFATFVYTMTKKVNKSASLMDWK